MKNLFLIVSAVCLSIMISGCDNDGGYASISWEECSVTYTFLNYFPEYDGDIENAYYVNDNEGESLMFCDYDVDRENVNTFKTVKQITRSMKFGFDSSLNATFPSKEPSPLNFDNFTKFYRTQ